MAVAATQYGKIGPNSIIQTIAALKEVYDPAQSYAILMCGGAARLTEQLPSDMVEEQEFYALTRALIVQIGDTQARRVLERAGQLTAVYLLQNRIPRPAQWLLRALPARRRLRLLLPAVARHAWTFAGSGAFTFETEPTPWVSIASPALQDQPEIAGAVCSFYKGTFAYLMRALVDRRMTLWETACQSHGAAACIYRFV